MNSENSQGESTTGICCNGKDAETFWRKSVKQTGFNAKDDGVFVITLDEARRFTGCHQIMSKVFRSPVLFADEIANLKALDGIEEFIVLHNRPGESPEAGPEDKARAKEIALAAKRKNSALLDYIIIGSADERYREGRFTSHRLLAKWIKAKTL
jgi:DNA repair protein RadC